MEKGPKTLIKSLGLYSHQTAGKGRFISLNCYKTSAFRQIQKIFNPMAIDVWRKSLTYEKLPFLHYSVRGVIYPLINNAIFQSFCNHEIFVKLNLPIFLVLVKQREKSQEYFNLWLLTRIGIIQICEILLLV